MIKYLFQGCKADSIFEMRQGCPLSLCLFNILLEVLASEIKQQQQKMRCLRIGKRGSKILIICRNMIANRKHKAIYKLLEIIGVFSKIIKSVAFL